MQFANVNFLAVVAAAAAAWITGAIWYGALFTNAWLSALGKTVAAHKKEMKAKGGAAFAPYALAFLANLIMAFVLYGLMRHVGAMTIRSGLISGAFCWFGFVLTSIAVNNAFAGRKSMLTVIDAGHWLAALLVTGAVLGAMSG